MKQVFYLNEHLGLDPLSNNRRVKNINSLFHNNPSMVAMTAPWCPHCQEMDPVLNNVFRETRNNSKLNNFKLIRIEDEALKKFPQFKPQGYPTIQFYINGKLMDKYDGNKNKDELIQFINHNINKNKKNNNTKKRSVSLKSKKKSLSARGKGASARGRRKRKLNPKNKKTTLKKRRSQQKILNLLRNL